LLFLCLYRVAEWADSIGQPDLKFLPWNLVRNYVVCDEHFRDEDFTNSRRIALNRSAVPIPYKNTIEQDSNNCVEEAKSLIQDLPQCSPEESRSPRNRSIDLEENSIEQTYSNVCTLRIPPTSFDTVRYEEEELDHNFIELLKQKLNNTSDTSNSYHSNLYDDTSNLPHRNQYLDDTSNGNILCDNQTSNPNLEVIEQTVQPDNLKQKMFFRRLCTTPLNLPSTKWGIHVHPEYINICRVSKISVERGICFTDETAQPEIRIHGQIIEIEYFKEVKSIKEVEHLISIVDQINLCPGTGLQDCPNSPDCAGVARLSDTEEYIPCLACNTLKLLQTQA
jgi:hypothetical protein